MDSGSDPANDYEPSDDDVGSCTALEQVFECDGSSILPSEVEENIQIHLDYVYPLDQPRISGCDRWITSSNLDILEIDPFIIASAHELNLYHICQYIESGGRLSTLVEWSKANSPTCAQTRRAQLLTRIKVTISILVPKLIRCGFLVRIDGFVQKSPRFEGAWKLRRHQYIDKHHGGSLNEVIGFKIKPPSALSCPHHYQRKFKKKSKSATSKSRNTVNTCPPKRQKVYDTDTDYEVPDDDAPRLPLASRTETGSKGTYNMMMNQAEFSKSTQQLSSNSNSGPSSTFITPYSPPDTPRMSSHATKKGAYSSTGPAGSTSLNDDTSITVAAAATIPQMKIESDTPRTRSFRSAGDSNLYDASRAGTPDVIFVSENRLRSPSTLPTVGDSDLPAVKSESAVSSLDNSSVTASEIVVGPKTVPIELTSCTVDTSTSAGKLPTPTSPTPETAIPKINAAFSLPAERKTTIYQSPYAASIKPPSAQQTEPMELTLQFALQDSNGDHDDEPSSLLSLRKIASLNVRDLFTLINQTSGRSPNALTFTTQWQEVENMIELVVRHSAGDGAWERKKKKLDAILKNEKRVYRGKKAPELVGLVVGIGRRLMMGCEVWMVG